MSFHESTVIHLQYGGSRFLIELEGVIQADSPIRVVLTFRKITNITVNGKGIADYDSKHKDGEVIAMQIDQDKKQCQSIIEWNDFKHHTSIVESFKFDYAKYEIVKIENK